MHPECMRLLIIAIFLPLVSYSQRDEWNIAFLRSIPDSFGKPFHLPEPWYHDFDAGDVAPYYEKERTLVITNDSLYKKIFASYRFTKDSLKASGLDKNDYYYKWMVQHL